MNDLKHSLTLPPSFVTSHPEEASVIEICILTKPLHRPSASALIEDLIFHELHSPSNAYNRSHTPSPHSKTQTPFAESFSNHSLISHPSTLSTLFHRRRSSTFSVAMSPHISTHTHPFKPQTDKNESTLTPCSEPIRTKNQTIGQPRRWGFEQPQTEEAQSANLYSTIDTAIGYISYSDLVYENKTNGIEASVNTDPTQDAKNHILRLENNVKSLMAKLDASHARESQLQSELATRNLNDKELKEECKIGRVDGKKDEERKLGLIDRIVSGGKSDVEIGSQPITIPKRRFW